MPSSCKPATNYFLCKKCTFSKSYPMSESCYWELSFQTNTFMMSSWCSLTLELARIRFSLLQAAEYMEKIWNTLPFSSQSTQDSGWKSPFCIFNSREWCYKKIKAEVEEYSFMLKWFDFGCLFLWLPFWRTEVLMTHQKLSDGQIIRTVWVQFVLENVCCLPGPRKFGKRSWLLWYS